MTEYTIQDQINIYITAITELDNVTRMEHEEYYDDEEDISLYESYEVWQAKQELYACLGELYYKQLQKDNTTDNPSNIDDTNEDEE